MSDKAIAEYLGSFIRHHRLAQNKTQQELAWSAGISRSTLSLLERGETVNLTTLIQVLRMLEQLHVLSVFEAKETVSPLALAKLQKEKRKRATGSSNKQKNEKKSDW
jgi:transcriptional regulator with XRE-family HTH domain